MSEVNNIPKHWQIKKLGEVGKIVSGGTPSTKVSENWDGNISWISPADLSGYKEKFILKGRKSITESGLKNSSATLIPKGSVLFSSRAPIGYVVIAGKEVCTNQGFKSIVPDKLILSDYLFYFLKASKQEAEKVASGTTFKEISLKVFSDLKIPLPPLPEQQLIVSKIEELLSDLENGKQQLQTAQQQLKVYRQSLLKAAFEGKLTNKEVKEGELPKGWKWVTSEEVTSKITDGEHLTPKRISKGEMLLSAKNIRDGFIDYTNYDCISKADFDKCLLRCDPEVGDLLIVSVGATIGRASLVKENKKFALVRSVALIKPNKINGTFLLYYIQSPQTQKRIQELSQGSAQNCLYLNKIKQIEIPLPPPEEQQLIVSELDSKLTVCDKIEETISQSLQQAETLRQSILKKAFEGRLVATTEHLPIYKPKSVYFYQMQVLGLIAKASKQKEIRHGEMTIAKYAYFIDKIYQIPTYYKFDRFHLGPYPPEIKKAINNKKFFKIEEHCIEVTDEDTLFKYTNPNKEKINKAVDDLSEIFSKYEVKTRTHKIELLATVCKVIEDIRSMDLMAVRLSMKEWEIKLSNSHFRNKAEKFSETETEKCLQFVHEKGWDKKLINKDEH